MRHAWLHVDGQHLKYDFLHLLTFYLQQQLGDLFLIACFCSIGLGGFHF